MIRQHRILQWDAIQSVLSTRCEPHGGGGGAQAAQAGLPAAAEAVATVQWRRHSHIWWHAKEVATGARVRLAIDARNEGAVWRRMTSAEEWADGHIANATLCPSLHETEDTSAIAAWPGSDMLRQHTCVQSI